MAMKYDDSPITKIKILLEFWKYTFDDLISVLFCLFVCLFLGGVRGREEIFS